jgi:hypothetical protein
MPSTLALFFLSQLACVASNGRQRRRGLAQLLRLASSIGLLGLRNWLVSSRPTDEPAAVTRRPAACPSACIVRDGGDAQQQQKLAMASSSVAPARSSSSSSSSVCCNPSSICILDPSERNFLFDYVSSIKWRLQWRCELRPCVEGRRGSCLRQPRWYSGLASQVVDDGICD